MIYRLTLWWAGGFPGSPEQDTVEITEAEYDELWARFIKPKAIAEGWCKDGEKMIPTEADRMQAARDARVRIGEDTDYKLYGAISKKPGSSVYDLANELRWSTGKVYGSIKRLEKDGWIRTEKAERGGRSVLKIEPVKWHEFLTPEEIEEFKKGDW